MKFSIRMTVLAALALAAGATAQEVLNLSGKITDPTGAGVPGVSVSLKKLKASTLTSSDGTYHLDATTALGKAGAFPTAAGFSLRHGGLEYRVERDGDPVRITLRDLSGRALAVLAEGPRAAGTHHASLAAAPVSGVAFLDIRIGRDAFTAKVVSAQGRLALASLGRLRVDAAGPLAKAAAGAALQDSILVSKAGYDPDYKRIDSYQGVHNFFLVKPVEFWGDLASQPQPAAGTMRYYFLNRTRGKYADNQIHWKLEGLKLGSHTERIPVQSGTLADKPWVDLPPHHGGRVTFHLGSPNSEYTDFIEQTLDPLGWHGNTTRVDAYVLPMAMRLICSDRDERLGEKYEIFYLGREKFFELYKKTVPVEFHHTVDNGKGVRIIAPGKGDGGFGPGVNEKYRTYFDAYLRQLGINGDGATTWQAFQCHGFHFGENAELCGAVNRHVAHLPKSEWHKPVNFYKASPANWYAKFFHDYSFQEKAYGFAYDDAANMAAYSECLKPKSLAVAIGF